MNSYKSLKHNVELKKHNLLQYTTCEALDLDTYEDFIELKKYEEIFVLLKIQMILI